MQILNNYMLASLERKIPPPVVALLMAGLMWLLVRKLGAPSAEIPYKAMVCAVFVTLGLWLDFAAVWLFRRAKTTVNPIRPNNASSLVTSGIYQYTRNPMYVGNLIFLLAWLVWLGSLFGFIGLVIYVAYMNQFQIKPEEKALTKLFNNEYRLFCSQVRRWI